MLRGLFSASGLRCDVKCSVAAGQENEGENERLQMVVEMKAFKPLGGLQNGAASWRMFFFVACCCYMLKIHTCNDSHLPLSVFSSNVCFLSFLLQTPLRR